MKSNFLLFSLASILLFTSCEKDLGEWVSAEIKTARFSEISHDASVDIILSQGPVYEIYYEGYDLILDDLDFNVLNGRLIIRQFGHYWSSGKSNIYITVPDLSFIELTSSGDIYSDTRFVPRGDLELFIRGSGDIDMNIDVSELWTTMYGSGDLRLRGFADFHSIEHDGSGSIYNFGFRADDVKIIQNSFGRSEIFANRNLYVRLRGAGDIYFIGNPFLNYFVTGSGRLIDAN